jgi:hypothetical protein
MAFVALLFLTRPQLRSSVKQKKAKSLIELACQSGPQSSVWMVGKAEVGSSLTEIPTH